MLPPTIKSLTRHELYDLVWSKPFRMLAPEYGLSDVGLAKICKRYSIPRPPFGYWAKIRHGKKVARAPLPTAPEGVEETIRIEVRPERLPLEKNREYFDAEIGSLAAAVQAGRLIPPVPESLRVCHALTARTRDRLYGRGAGRRNRLGGERGEVTAAVRVSAPQRQRSLRLLDAVMKMLESFGVETPEPEE